MFWTEEHTNALRQFYAAGSNNEKRQIVDKYLGKVLYELARRALTSLNLPASCENQQDVVIHLVVKTLPKLSEEKLQAGFQYLWTAARNYSLTYVATGKKWHDINTTNTTPGTQYDPLTKSRLMPEQIREQGQPMITGLDIAEMLEDRDKLKARVLQDINTKLQGQNLINCANSVFLLLLKDYLLANDFDVRGFGDYVMQAMNLKLCTYRAIAGRLGFRTKDFNEKVEKISKDTI